MATARSTRKTLVVTGASSGIGRALALRAAQEGYNVVASARRTERLREVSEHIAGNGGACTIATGDVTDPGTAKNIVASALRDFGRIDVLINNAGTGAPGNLLEQTDAALDGQWHLHVTAPLRLTRMALPSLQAAGGIVFFVGSGLARVPAPGFGAYCAAKAAVRAVATQLRRELRGTGVAVTYVDPGGVDTEFSAASGMQRSANDAMLASPERVAARILRAVRTRTATVSGVPVHAISIAIGAAFPAIADAVIERVVDKPQARNGEPRVREAEPAAASSLAQALEPVARRMERVNLPAEFLAELLVPETDLHLTDVAMRWAGMPNKNERAAVSQALDALAAGGFLEKTGDETWHVVRSAS